MNFILKRENLFLLCFISLLISLYFDENSSGGAYKDFLISQKYVSEFQNDILNGFKIFILENRIHLPFFYLVKSKLLIIFPSLVISFFYLVISSLIPIFLYKILKKKFIKVDKNYLFFLSMIIFFSPYFRSSAVWASNDNIALLFFLISIYYFFCFKNQKEDNFKYSLISFFFLILSCYIRQNYFLFSLIYFYFFYKNLNILKFFTLITFNILISIPVFIYVYFFYLVENSESTYLSDLIKFDIIFSVLVFTSLFLFYIIPIFLNNFSNFDFFTYLNKRKSIIFSLFIIFSLLIFFYEIPSVQYGGGIFYKISNLANINFLYFFSFFGLFFFIEINENKTKNYIVWLILIFSFPLIYIYQKYYDPLIYIILLILIDSKILNNLIENKKISLPIFYSYILIFLIISIIYYR